MSRLVDWTAPALTVAGGDVFPARHVWCVGRNYAEHAREMNAEPGNPIFFSKPATALVNDETIDYPPDTSALHHEVELVVVLGRGGRRLGPEACLECIAGYAVGVDLTRRDVQSRAKQAGHPWEASKGFDQSAPLGAIVPAERWSPDAATPIELQVNGQVRQQACLGDMIWPVGALLSRLSETFSLQAGDVIFTGTPAGVGALEPGDHVTASIGNLPQLSFGISPEQ
ncbi:fumarylacetoacetate hydrolase family protein [Wenzhouxiangella sp. AB-CW3]|uniref:fumarylacetoacetate hydrolase family protein n=1 Tax=Wenzhouxiangella sp. AB-CW3 TaxID=2771012 RepID=UPI00168B351D|nr:fumarylacetoacetate hydrolase family protein [Wenzhouxiangella sp. AB-CW3]QOC21301.1 fumarylacetoacetate hydrolase family protein [Wenzhouxiangella sp. AB-CW3]